MVTLEMTLYHVSSNKCQSAYFQISTKRMGTYPKKGTESRGRLFFFPLNKLENGQGVPSKFTASYTKRAAIR